MILFPKKTKYKKAQKGRITGFASNGSTIAFGSYGLKAIEPCRLTARQIEAARKAIIRKIKKIGKLWIRVFPDIPVTSKPAEVRMGKGKGAVSYWMVRIKPGKILFEISKEVSQTLAKEALTYGASKLPTKTIFMTKNI